MIKYCCSIICVAILLGRAESQEPDLEFKPRRLVKAFPAIKDPEIVVAKDADFMRAEELVIGVEVGGRARAYPINMLTGPTREIINDTLGGQPIAATW